MKLKIFNRFLIPALIVGAMGTFSSCKDTTEDYWNDIQNQIGNTSSTLTDQLNADVATLTSALGVLQAQTDNLESELTQLQIEAQNHVTYDEMNAAIAAAIATVQTQIDTNKANIQAINDLLGENAEGAYPTVAARLVAMEEEIARIANLVDDPETGLSATHALAVQANNQATQNLTYIQNLQAAFDQYKLDNDAAVAQLGIDLSTLSGEFEAYKTATDQAIADIWDAIQPALQNVQNDVATLQGQMTQAIADIADLQERVAAAESKINSLESQLTALTGWTTQISNRISSMCIEAAASPVLGYLKTPLGIQGNILFNWFGQSLNDVQFPQLTATGDCYGMEPEVYAEGNMYVNPDLYSYFLSHTVSVAANEYYMVSEDNSLGSVYVSVNPLGIDMDGKDFNLFSAKGLYNALAISEVKPYYGDLNFGYSRATTSTNYSNGLYEVTTSLKALDKATIDELHFDLEPGMKSELKDLLKDRNLSSLAGFANLVYNQFKANGDCALPALAVNAKWSETDAEGNNLNYSVNTSYSLAAATVRPLSFATIPPDADFSKYLRNLPNLDEFMDNLKFDLEGKFKIELEPITINGITLNPITITINKDEVIATVDVPNQFEKDASDNIIVTGYETVEIKAESLESLVNNINTQLSSFTGNTQLEINNMIASIQGQINDMLDSITDQVDESVDALQNEINGKIEDITSKIKNYYSKIERVYDRVKGYLTHPSDYMQVTMLYNAANGIHRASSSKVAPSYITAGKIVLMPTTYNAEILTPAYKKYVAVSNVYVSDDYAVNATNDTACLDLMKKANQGQYMNKVVSGERRTVVLNANTLQAGYTYEILYQALDFRGKISTQKFYINIR